MKLFPILRTLKGEELVLHPGAIITNAFFLMLVCSPSKTGATKALWMVTLPFL